MSAWVVGVGGSGSALPSPRSSSGRRRLWGDFRAPLVALSASLSLDHASLGVSSPANPCLRVSAGSRRCWACCRCGT